MSRKRWRGELRRLIAPRIIRWDEVDELKMQEPYAGIIREVFNTFEDFYVSVWTDLYMIEVKVFTTPEQKPPDILLGFVLHLSMPTTFLSDVAVHPTYRNQGYGAMVFVLAQKISALTGHAIMAWTEQESVEHILDKLGWQIVLRDAGGTLVYAFCARSNKSLEP